MAVSNGLTRSSDMVGTSPMCKTPACWWIEFGHGPDDYTESCSEHLGALAEGCVAIAHENMVGGTGRGLVLDYTTKPNAVNVCCWMPLACGMPTP